MQCCTFIKSFLLSSGLQGSRQRCYNLQTRAAYETEGVSHRQPKLRTVLWSLCNHVCTSPFHQRGVEDSTRVQVSRAAGQLLRHVAEENAPQQETHLRGNRAQTQRSGEFLKSNQLFFFFSLLFWWILSFIFCSAALSLKVRPEQRRIYALPQSPPNETPDSGHLSRQRDWREHGGVATGESGSSQTPQRPRTDTKIGVCRRRRWECLLIMWTSSPGCFRTSRSPRTSTRSSKRCTNTTSWLYQVPKNQTNF